MKKLRYLILALFAFILVACQDTSSQNTTGNHDFQAGDGGTEITLVAGSENSELEPIIQEFAEEADIVVNIDYLGSLDIMRMLQSGEVPYDGLWPASSIWLNIGDDHRMLKHTETTSISPIVFGIKESLAESLGFVGEDVYIADIMEAINSGELKFAMTSATQSNSGASAYIGFLTALADSDDGLTSEDLQDSELQEDIISLLSGVNRSSGSSNWLVDLFLTGDYDAMVNYETLIIQTNRELIAQGKEPLYLVYPVDGLSISDSPLAYVDKGDEDKEEAFLMLQDYLLSQEAQLKIQDTGKRSAYGTVDSSKTDVFRSDWGIDLDKVISPIRWPQSDVIVEALNLYQTEFKKPGLTFYVLDYSGSMYGEGNEQMIEALEQVLIPENATQHLLLPTTKDITYIVPFSDDVFEVSQATGNGQDLARLYDHASSIRTTGGTAMYEGIFQALEIAEDYGDDLENYTPAIILLTDGVANGALDIDDLEEYYRTSDLDVPIFSIMFGDARDAELLEIAQLSRARVFDGRENLIDAFQTVKGYN